MPLKNELDYLSQVSITSGTNSLHSIMTALLPEYLCQCPLLHYCLAFSKIHLTVATKQKSLTQYKAMLADFKHPKACSHSAKLVFEVSFSSSYS